MTDFASKLRGKFIVLDGPDGAGKSTQLKLLAEFLRGQGLTVCVTRDPGGTAIGHKIREILLDNTHTEMTVGCEILLYMASRAQLAGEVILPAIQRGECVLCDRWVSSTAAYQVAEGKATCKDVWDVYRVALGDLLPNLTLILDVDPKTGLDRAGQVRGHDRIEAKGVDFHRRVRELFLEEAKYDPARYAVVDGRAGINEVQTRLRETLAQRLGNLKSEI